MTCTNFPSSGLVANVTTHQVGEILYKWTGSVWEAVSPPVDFINNLSLPYVFGTVELMKNSTIAFPVGKNIKTQGYYSKGDGGQCDYLVQSSGTPDEYGDHTLNNGNIAEMVIDGFSINVAKYGITGNKPDNHTRLQAMVSKYTGKQRLTFNIGTTEFTGGISVPSTGIFIEGSNRAGCIIQPIGDFTMFEHSLNMIAKDLQIIQQTQYTGIAFGTAQTDSNTAQAAYCKFDNVRVIGFHYSYWWRASLWNSFKDCYSKSRVGVRFARAADPYERGATQAPSGWNIFSPTLGWFHNIGTMDNFLFEDVECGVWGCCMGYTFTSVTCQRQNQDKANNVILPVTEDPTGMWLHSGTDGTRGNWMNSIIEFYAEATIRPLKIQDIKAAQVQGMFAQGHTSGDPYYAPIECDNSTVYVEALTGQDWFQFRAVVKNGGTYYGTGGGAVSGNISSVDATSNLYNFREREPFETKYSFTSSNGGDVFELPVTIASNSHYELFIGGLFDGFSMRGAAYDVYRWTTDGLSNINTRSGSETNFSVAMVGGKLQVTHATSSTIIYDVVLREVSTGITQDINLTAL